jgi:crotonobetainyl-CoA:carnitine CoA-transferase CaiB-like acyl-CoA transferase
MTPTSPGSTPTELPLSGLRVLDFSERLAGAYCTKLLADAGADVLKVEGPQGDPLRHWSVTGSLGSDGDEDGALFRYLCASKRSVTLDLDTEGGQEEARRLALEVDLVVETWQPGVAEARHLDLTSLEADNPGVSVVSISAFGRGGPRSTDDLPEFVLQALSGSTFEHGTSDREPMAVAGRLGEWAAGTFAAGSAVAYQRSRAEGKPGHHIDVSILEAMAITLVTVPVIHASLKNETPPRAGNVVAPGIEPCSDGWVGFFCLTAQQWQDFLAMTGLSEKLDDPAFNSLFERGKRIDEIRPVIRDWTGQHTTREILELAEAFRVPASPVASPETLTDVEQLHERQVFVANPRGGFRQPRSPFHWGVHQGRPIGQAPRLGTAGSEPAAWSTAPRKTVTPTAPADGAPLAGVRVLDLTAFWAGPFATQMLVSLGADVIKVESIQHPDAIRFASFAPPTDPHWFEQGPLYNGVNLGKRSVTINISSPAGRDLLLRLAETCDVVVENFTPRVFDNFGLSYESFASVRPDIIVVRMPGFGLDGPWRNRAGFATTMEQVSGLAWIGGYEGGDPVLPNGAIDPTAGAHAAFAVATALEHRRRTGEGQLIELPLVEVATAIAGEALVEYEAYGNVLTRHGNRTPNRAPQGVYPSSGEDAWMALSVDTVEQWQGLCGLIGRPEWAKDPSLDEVDGRAEIHDDIDAAIAAWSATLSASDAADALLAAGVPAAPVMPASTIYQDTQMQARHFWEEVDHPFIGKRWYAGFPFGLAADRWYPGPAPLFASSNDEVLTELGLDRAQIEELANQQVIGTRPLGI